MAQGGSLEGLLALGVLVDSLLVSGGSEAEGVDVEVADAAGNRPAAGFAGAVFVTATLSSAAGAAGDEADNSPGGGRAGPYTGELSRSVAGRGDSGGVRSVGPTFLRRRRLPAFDCDPESESDRESELESELERESDPEPESESESEPYEAIRPMP